MKAISIRQPDATAVAEGRKTIEIRTWRTWYRGDLLIVSTKRPKIEPAGFALAIVELYDCRLMRPEDEPAACCALEPGAWAWMLRNISRVDPFPVKGRLNFFDVRLPTSVLGVQVEVKTASAGS